MSYTERGFIEKMAPLIVAACKGTGIFPSVVIGQACAETGYGNLSGLVPYHNYFGMMVALTSDYPWNGPSIAYDTFEYYDGKTKTPTKAAFRVYGSDAEGIADYVGYLTKTKKYRPVTNCATPEEQITMIRNKGYATAPNYIESVISIINKHSLKEFDMNISIRKIASWTHYNFTRCDRTPKYICIHYTANAFSTAAQNANYYNGSVVHASADFFTDETEIVQLNLDIPHYYSWATGKKWYDGKHGAQLWGIATIDKVISIEVCCKTHSGKQCPPALSADWYYDAGAITNTIKLVRYLMETYNIPISRVVRHYDICGKYCPGIVGWTDVSGDDSAWRQFLNDCSSADGSISSWGEADSAFACVYDDAWYKYMYPDIKKAFGTKSAYKHYVDYGRAEGRTPSPVYQPEYYKAQYGDLQDAFNENSDKYLNHFIKYTITGKELRRAAFMFNLTYYKKQYADLREAFGDDNEKYFAHFLAKGMLEMRQACKEFNPTVYAKKNADVKALVKEMGDNRYYYYHYLKYGIYEGRKCK